MTLILQDHTDHRDTTAGTSMWECLLRWCFNKASSLVNVLPQCSTSHEYRSSCMDASAADVSNSCLFYALRGM
jgi:hypothetical protein